MSMLRTPNDAAALRERADELESPAHRLRRVADGDWPEAGDTVVLEAWSVSQRSVETLKGRRADTGQTHLSSPLVVLDEAAGRALSMGRVYRLGAPRGPA